MPGSPPLKLNIGAGATHIPGWINIDISERADVTLDLGKEPLPFENDSVERVFSYHTLEHVDDYLFALGEIHRVLRHGGVFLVGLPYVTLTRYHLVNPYHRHNFNEHSFDFFGKLKGDAQEQNSILFDKIFHRFHYIGIFKLVPPPLRGWCRSHLLNVVRKIDFGLVAIKDPKATAPLPPGAVSAMRAEFLECLRSRRRYGVPPRDPSARMSFAFRLRVTVSAIARWWRGGSD